MLAGPSNAGLTDPGHSTAISLLQINSALLALQLTFDNLVALRVMLLLENEIGEMFLDADRRLQEDKQSFVSAKAQERMRDSGEDGTAISGKVGRSVG